MSKQCCALLILLMTVAGVSFGQVVDGNLADLIPLAQADQADPINEVCAVGKSGFDFSHIYVYYNVAADQLFFGVDIMDVPPGNGLNGAGVPGDADGNNSPDTLTNPACVASPFVEEPGVGPDEEYSFFIDTNGNGVTTDHTDVHVRYQGNTLQILPGDSIVPIPGASGIIKLGTAGAGGGNTGIPDGDENTSTNDIEVRINNWSTLDPTPTCFNVIVRAGSLVDGLPEDTSNTIVFNISSAAVDVTKDVENVTAGGSFADSVGARVGDTVRFRLQIHNTGNVVLNGVGMRDILPNGLTFANNVTGTASFAVTPISGGRTQIDFTNLSGSGSLPVGVTRTVTFDATVNGNVTGCMINTVTGGGRPPVECGGPRVLDSDTAQVCLVDINCTKQVSLDGSNYSSSVTAVRGQTVHFRIVVSNPSTSDLANVTVTDTLPGGFTNIQESDPQCSVAAQTLTCNLGTLAGGASRTINFTAVISNSAIGTLVNSAHVTGSFGGSTVSHDCQAQVDVVIPCVSCDKKVSLDGVNFFASVTAAPGQTVSFRVQITNCGTASLTTVTLSDTLPAGYTNVQVISPGACSAAGNAITCSNLGPLGPGAMVVVRYRATVSANSGTLTNTATVNGSIPPATSQDQCSAQVTVQPPCIQCVKEVSLDGTNYFGSLNVTTANAALFWRITVTNCGQIALNGVTLHDVLPASLVNVSTSDGRCSVFGNTVDCNLGTLAGGASTSVVIQSNVAGGFQGNIQNTATVSGHPGSSGNPGTSVSDDCSSVVTVGPPPRIPTLGEWGLILLSGLLGAALVLHRRMQ
ncbi:MAG: DUF11 domain-containing protein [Planctomycetes bacterium]|nr:DUF11 domain-containing protein [Planctomycetota bacterium]MBI3843617.1 DUF11 domain-containing protein [Planctomycetota bacterium]